MDEFGFEYKGGRVYCEPAGGAIASVPFGGQARASGPIWDIRMDGVPIGQFDAEMGETKESVREAAIKLIDAIVGE